MMPARYETPHRRSLVVATTVVFTVLLMACTEDPVEPGLETPVILEQGLNAYLVVSAKNKPVGSEFWVEARVRAVGTDVTPTAFVANLRFDAERAVLIDMVSLADGVLRVANLNAGPGLMRVAGAAANGFGTETLFIAQMKVKAKNYIEGLRLELDELAVLEDNFADKTEETTIMHEIIPDGTPVVSR